MSIIKIYTYSSFGCISLWKICKTTAAHYVDINLKNNCSLNPVSSSLEEADSGPTHERHASLMALLPAQMGQVQGAATAFPMGKWGAGFCLRMSQTAAVSIQAYKNSQSSRLCSDPSNRQTCWKLARSGKTWVFGNSANGAVLIGNFSGWCCITGLTDPACGQEVHRLPKHEYKGPSEEHLLPSEMTALLKDNEIQKFLRILISSVKNKYRAEDTSWFLQDIADWLFRLWTFSIICTKPMHVRCTTHWEASQSSENFVWNREFVL